MDNRLRRSLPLAAALSAVLAFVGFAKADGPFIGSLTLVCPDMVWAGETIYGYVVNSVPTVNVTGETGGGAGLVGSPVSGQHDPVYFAFATIEPMSGTIVFVRASDSSGATASDIVAVL